MRRTGAATGTEDSQYPAAHPAPALEPVGTDGALPILGATGTGLLEFTAANTPI